MFCDEVLTNIKNVNISIQNSTKFVRRRLKTNEILYSFAFNLYFQIYIKINYNVFICLWKAMATVL